MTDGPITDDVVRLRDGRALAYAVWGDPLGFPVFFFHGTPMSRLYCPDQAVTASRRVRLVTVDRPGIGRSDVPPRRTYADWPNDVEAVRESVRQGPEAFAWELIDCFLPWGFRVADIAIRVQVFHGAQDTWVARPHVDFLVEKLPDARLTVFPDSGHGPARHWGEIVDTLTR